MRGSFFIVKSCVRSCLSTQYGVDDCIWAFTFWRFLIDSSTETKMMFDNDWNLLSFIKTFANSLFRLFCLRFELPVRVRSSNLIKNKKGIFLRDTCNSFIGLKPQTLLGSSRRPLVSFEPA